MYNQRNFNEYPGLHKRKKRYKGVILLISLVAVGFIFFKTNIFSREIDINNDDTTLWGKVTSFLSFGKTTKEEDRLYEKNYVMPEKEGNRHDILILGIRGEDQPDSNDTGALLTDTILVFSFDKNTKKSSLVSIPRDLYVSLYNGRKDKINAAYETGLIRKEGLNFTKDLVSKITGVYVDNIVVFDFSSFKKIVDDLGGVDIELAKPFEEKQQWGFSFSLPAGKNHLDGQTALYYVRSRFSSNDFDRSQRQQQVITAIKDKLLKLNFLSDPIKALAIFNTIRTNINTDLDIWDATTLFSLAKEVDSSSDKIKKFVISTENLVQESHIDNIYVLLPKGDNFDLIKKEFKEILK